MDNTDVMEIINDAEAKVAEAVKGLPRVSVGELGYDRRAGKVWVDVNNGYVIVNKLNGSGLAYYAGFEYVDKDSVTVFGDYTIYDDGDDRVYDLIEKFEDKQVAES